MLKMSDNSTLAATARPTISVRFVMTGLLLVILLAAVEQTIVAVSLPAIAAELHGMNLVAWVVAAYLIGATVATPIYGKLSDIYGRKATMTSAISLFLLASVACALAQTMPQLIAFRLLQGLGGGGLISVAQATIADVISLRDRGKYQAYISAVWLVASTGGPVAGGYLTQHLSWHWIFWVNLPIGIVALIVMRSSLRHLSINPVMHSIDYIGAILFASGISSVLIALTRIGQGAPVRDSRIIFLLTGGVLTVTVFIWHARRVSEPIIPLRMFRNRTVFICCVAQFLGYFQMLSMLVLIPLRLQMVSGVAPEIASFRLLPLTLAVPCGAFVAGRLMSVTGRYKPSQLGGAVIVTLAATGLAFVDPERIAYMAVAMVILGLGIGLQFPTSMVATQNAVPRSQTGAATALASFSRMLGGAIGVSVLTSLLIAFLRNLMPPVATGTVDVNTMLSTFHSIGLGTNGAVLRDAAEIAFRNVFVIGAAVSLISPLLILRVPEHQLRGNAETAVPAE